MGLECVKGSNLPIFACLQTRALPKLPALPENIRESDLYHIVNKHGKFPPIMKTLNVSSLTLKYLINTTN